MRKKENELCELVIKNKILTDDLLYKAGFIQNDINYFLNKNILKKKHNIYTISAFCLIDYATYLQSCKFKDKALIVLKKAFEIEKNYKTSFHLFATSIELENYDEALYYLDKMFYYKNSYNEVDLKIYLILLNKITILPSKYKKIIKELEYNDFNLPNSKESIYRIDIYLNRFSKALQSLKKVIDEQQYKEKKLFIIKRLLTKVIQLEIETKNKILNLIKEENIDELINIFESKRRNLELKPIESMIYELIKKISILENSKYKPVPKIYYTNKSHVAIDGYNYELALNIAGEFSKTKNILLKDNILYQVLKLFNRILQDKEYNRDEYIEILTELISEKDITNLIICLKNYLNMIKKIEYFDLFIAIYKLSIWDNDYQDINNLLKNIDDILNYEKYVNRCLNSDNEEEIKLCLNILEIMHNFVDFEINELKERIFNQDLIIDLGKINELNEYIEKMYQQLLNNKSMVLLDRLDDDWHDYVISLMSKKNNVKVIEIDLDLEKRIVLIHVEKIEKFNKNLLMLESEKAYKEKRYRDSIEIQKQLLHDNFVQALYFELIGKSYYRLGLYNLALDYYLVALGLNMKENKISNVNELIKSLKKEIR